MARLIDHYAALIAFGLELDASIATGTPSVSAEQAQQGALLLIAQARRSALAAGQSSHAVESASFAMAAWFDEILARNPAWDNAITPLQARQFNSKNAHSEFFHHLSALQPQEGEVR